VPSWKRRAERAAAAAALAAAIGCAPRLGPLTGAPVPARFPDVTLGTQHRKIVFRWELNGPDLVARGDGAARIAPPDSARFDFFLADGNGSGAAVLIGDSLRLPPGGRGARLVPPAPMLWAALGRLALPPAADTEARLAGRVFTADIGRPVAWRATFDDGALVRLERVAGGRVQEWIARTPDGQVHYHDESDRRTLDLVILQSDATGPFDATIWTFP
jgi:hypothetical protein